MKSRFFSLITGLSIVLCLCVPGAALSEEPAVNSNEETASSAEQESISELKEMLREIASQNAAMKEDFAAFKTKVDMDIGEIKLVIDKKNQGLEDKMESIESRQEDIANRTLMHEVMSPPAEESEINKASREKTAKDEPAPGSKAVASDSKVLNDNAVKEFLNEYYVDVEMAVEDIKEEPKKEEEPLEDRIEPEKQESGKEKSEEVVKYVDKNLEEKKLSGEEKYEEDMQCAMKELHKAQKLFYAKRYDAALKRVGKSLASHETALAYALEGSILITMGDRDSAIEAWKTALELDPELDEVEEALDKYKRSN
ncbi:MAG: tetratricopeptide repeat protein [Elusimicrobiota bacterium]